MNVAAPSAHWATALRLAFLAGDLPHSLEIVEAAGREIPAVQVLDEVIAPAMHDVGALWEADEITVADEHLATATAHRLLAEVAPRLRVAEPETRELVVLAAPPPERHTTALIMAAAVLRGAGFRVKEVRGGVPLAVLLRTLAEEPPAVFALSATLGPTGETFRTLEAVAREHPRTALLAGGYGIPQVFAPLSVRRVPRMADLLPTVERALRA